MVVDYTLDQFGFLISIPGVRNVLQNQEGFPIKKKKKISTFLCFLGGLAIIIIFFFFGTIFEKVICKISEYLGNKFDFDFFFIRNTFLTLEDVPDSWDGDQEPKMVQMYSQWPYLSFAKRLGSIPSSSSEILMHVTRVTFW